MDNNNEHVKLINYYALIISAIFGIFGGALVSFLGVPELKLRYISIAQLMGLVLVLLIRLLLTIKMKAKIKTTVKIVAVILFAGLVFSYMSFDKSFNKGTFSYTDSNDSTAYYVKGSDDQLQPAANFFAEGSARRQGKVPSDQDLVDNFGGINIREGVNNIPAVWLPSSISANKQKLINNYMIMAMLFVATIYFIVEVLVLIKKQSDLSLQSRKKRNLSKQKVAEVSDHG